MTSQVSAPVALSSAVFAANADALRAQCPSWAFPATYAEVVTCHDGVWRYVHGGRNIAIHGRQPDRDADRVADEALSGSPAGDLIIVVGAGLGYVIDALERRRWMGRVLVPEPDAETAGPLLARRDWTSLIGDGRLRVLVGPDYKGASDCWSWLGDGTWDPCVLTNPQLATLYPEATVRAGRLVSRLAFDARANADARRAFAPRYLLNSLRNLPAVVREGDAADLAGAAVGRPAVLVGAGPSLAEAIPSLRDVRDRVLVIAVDTAVRPLREAGIDPHLIVAVDPSEQNARHLTDLADGASLLVAEASLDPHALAAFAGRTFLFTVSDHQPWPWVRDAGRSLGRLRAWGSVLTTAFDLARSIGCDPIVFVGADLSYPNGQPYVRGVTFEDDWRRAAAWGEPIAAQWARALGERPRVEEPAVQGGTVPTAAHMVAFRDWLAEQADLAPRPRVINATGEGILRGTGIEQIRPAALPALVPDEPWDVAPDLRARYRPSPGGGQLARAVDDLREGERRDDPAARAVCDAWTAFAPGVTRAAIRDALAYGARLPHEHPAGAVDPHCAEVAFDTDALQMLAAATSLVPVTMPAHRMLASCARHRVFKLRTDAARLATSVWRGRGVDVFEDGVPLGRSCNLNDLEPGTCVVLRGEVHFNPTDGSDPRFNGRVYTLLLPPHVAYLEALPEDVIARFRL